ncbi:MerR family transcriptional regulator [Kineosporia rhizophila]|uniref:MerR family transcriptional regulator n=1 Tax=Kineosporia TaxID=49184 RepID=UPI001E418D7A|nr:MULTISPECIES: MerR family transcriptional regulator [Kineosporia]MCE0534723.1 MerR family transcriptional regulator [Kineosporia rhizophila]GLY19352.1 MerR family transcriptional regulator [Kineosporia sp. NBRC 101677]
MSEPTMHIGEVAERVGLSLRTIRYYEEIGLIAPSARSQGGFRLYLEADVARLQLVKDMKPLGFSLDEMRDLLGVLDKLDDETSAEGHEQILERLAMYRVAADARCDALRGQLRIAESFAGTLRNRLTSHRERSS